MKPFQRRSIPTLKQKKIRKGLHSIVKRSYPVGEEDYFRLFRDETLPIQVRFKKEAPNLTVKVNTDISGQWEDRPMKLLENGDYGCELRLDHCGLFQFKVKYSYNEGKTWYLDNVPHTYVYVDPPSIKNLNLYTLIPKISGHFGKWKELLHHIHKQGFNAVHLLPITLLDTSLSPYAAKDFFSIDPTYLDPNDQGDVWQQFDSFVEEAKSLGIKLCFDLVVNHVGVTSNITQNCPNWIATDEQEEDAFKRAGCWDHLNWIKWRDLALLKYDHPNRNVRNELWNYMKEYVLFWSHYANYTDGLIRFDNLHSTNRAFSVTIFKEVHEKFPNLAILAELFTDLNAIERMVFEHGIHLLMATPWISPYAQQMREFTLFLHQVYPKIRYLFPINSHDSGSPTEEYGSPHATIPRYFISALMGTGCTGMTQGAEFGTPQKIKFIGPAEEIPLSRETWGFDFSKEIGKINHLKQKYELFNQGRNISFIDGGHGALLAAYRHDEEGNKFILISNLDTQNSYQLGIDLSSILPKNARLLVDQMDQSEIPVTSSHIEFYVEPCGVNAWKVI